MPRDKRSHSPEDHGYHKRSKQSHRSSRSPSPTWRTRNSKSDFRDKDREPRRDDWDTRRKDDKRRSHSRERRRSRSRDRRRSRSRDRDRDRDRDRRDRDRDSRATPPRSRLADAEKPQGTTPPSVEDPKIVARRERLEAWKKEREAKKALDEAKAKAMALAGKSIPVSESTTKPTLALNRAALGNLGLKGLPVRADALKASKTVASLDDSVESTRTLQNLSDLPAVDMTIVENGRSIGENLEAEDDDDEVKADVNSKSKASDAMDEDEDPLDAFMTNVKVEVSKVDAEDRKKMSKHRQTRRVDNDPELEDSNVDYEVQIDELDITDLNPEDILALAAKKAKKKDLAIVDHSKFIYEPFRKAFYHPPPDIAEMTEDEAELLRLALDGIKIRGVDCPKPVTKWSHFGMPASCLDVIKGLNYAAPTAIQSQAIPAIMSGRDVIGVAKTGSGKTIAFLLPMFRHIKDQRPLEQMEGPIAIIMTPTRELAVQIHRECKPFLKVLGLRAVCAYGGSPIKDQIAEMKKGAEIIVCTPGRMIDLLTANSGRVTNLKRVTYVVLDEADRMFDMGFEPQVMKIINNVRPDRQTVLFSATFPKQMDSLARKILKKPLEITVGGRSVVAPEIEQIVEVREEDTKFNRLLEILGQTYNEDPDCRTLIFVDRQEAADNLLRDLMRKGYLCMSLHGGKDQIDRDQTIADFKAGIVPIVTATSVAARGLDVKQLKLVINYDTPNHMEDYVHRAGRTGRAGNKGTCVTFITPEQDRYSVDIYRALKASEATPPHDLEQLANGFLEKVKAGKAQAAGSGFGGKGLDRLDRERDAKEKAERKAYGEGGDEKVEEKVEEVAGDDMTFGNFKVEIRRGPAPDASRPLSSKVADSAALKAQQVANRLNAQLRAKTQPTIDGSKKDPDATDFHAIIPINDYPQKARWRVTNKETMVQLIDMTGASVTNKGIYYESGKEPPPEGPPKLHLLVESNEEWRVEQAVREIKRLLVEASAAALQAESRNPTATTGRYSVI